MYIFAIILLFPLVMWFRNVGILYAILFPAAKIITYGKKLNQLKKLATLKHVDADNKNIVITFRTRLHIYYTCVCMVLHHIYISLFQLFNKSVIKINKNTYELTYMLNNNMYKMRIKTSIGPQPKIIQALNEVDHDITDTIVPYLGPSGNFHGIKYKPTDFNVKILTLNMSDTRELTFTENDWIVF